MHLSIRSLSVVPVALGAVAAAVGAAVTGLEAAVLWAVVGYFVGKTLQSLVWTVEGSAGSRG